METRTQTRTPSGAKQATALLVLAALFFLPGCERKERLKVGDAAPEFSVMDTTGSTVALGQFKGKVVVLYFWTNSCCRDTVKLIEPLYGKYREKGLALLAFDVGDSGETAASYAKSNGLTFPVLADERGEIFRQYRLLGFPTVLLLDKNGVIRQIVPGRIEAAQLEKLVQRQFDHQKETDAAYERLHSR